MFTNEQLEQLRGLLAPLQKAQQELRGDVKTLTVKITALDHELNQIEDSLDIIQGVVVKHHDRLERRVDRLERHLDLPPLD